MIGQTLGGKYHIVEQIGKGSTATVYKALDVSANRYVAVKVPSGHFTQSPDYMIRFEREFLIMAQQEHTSIPTVYDYGEHEGVPYLAMQYMSGGALLERIRAGEPLPLDEANRLLGQIASALDFIHRRGIIHRAVQPGDILLDEDGNAYLSDFGIAKMLEPRGAPHSTGIVGVPAYIAPELVQGMRADPRADVYALGVSVYEMLTGRVPYQADTPMGTIFKHVNEPVPSLREVKPDIPVAIDAVVQKALAKNPDERYQTAGELAAAFAQAVAEGQ
jgi:serine/threonine protein kinase